MSARVDGQGEGTDEWYRACYRSAPADTLDASVVRHNSYAQHAGDDERFVTALIVNIDAQGEAQVINCGHVPPWLLHEGTVTSPASDPGVPLGLAELATEPVTVDWFPSRPERRSC